MTDQELRNKMMQSNSEQEWDKNCDEVRHQCGGYPPNWYRVIVLGKVHSQCAKKWGGSGKIRIGVIK